jgi:hypothetical protein
MISAQTKQIQLLMSLQGTAYILNSLPLQGGRATNNTFAVREIFKDDFFSPLGWIVPSDNNV